MQVPLRERDRDTSFLERVVNRYRHLASDPEEVVKRGRPEQQAEIQRAGPESVKNHYRFRVTEHLPVPVSHPFQNLHHAVWIRPVGHTHVDSDPASLVG